MDTSHHIRYVNAILSFLNAKSQQQLGKDDAYEQYRRHTAKLTHRG